MVKLISNARTQLKNLSVLDLRGCSALPKGQNDFYQDEKVRPFLESLREE